jgi:hypothetical protein
MELARALSSGDNVFFGQFERTPQASIGFWRMNESLEEYLAVTIGKHQSFMTGYRFLRGSGNCSKAEIGEAAALESRCALHLLFRLRIYAKT